MKFAIVAVLTLALAMGAQSSIIPIIPGVTQVAGGGLSYTAVSSPAAFPSAFAVHAVGPAVWSVPHAVVAAPHAVVAAPHGVVVAGPAPAGSYVAQTRGAVHAAPLPGHIQSVANVNVAPAPGTL